MMKVHLIVKTRDGTVIAGWYDVEVPEGTDAQMSRRAVRAVNQLVVRGVS